MENKINKLRSVCEILREINDESQGKSKKDILIRTKCVEAEYKAKRMAKKLKQYNKHFNLGWWEENKDFEADLERRMQMDYKVDDRQMIVIVLGMHKSGTTMIAKSLHESGINMHPKGVGEYPQSKYEDPSFQRINDMILNRKGKRFSLDIPEGTLREDEEVVKEIKKFIKRRNGISWGAKHPDATLTYPVWRKYLPLHFVFGLYRPMDRIMQHYMTNSPKKTQDVNRIIMACNHYMDKLMRYDIPIYHYEELLEKGFKRVEEYLCMELVDTRRKGEKF